MSCWERCPQVMPRVFCSCCCNLPANSNPPSSGPWYMYISIGHVTCVPGELHAGILLLSLTPRRLPQALTHCSVGHVLVLKDADRNERSDIPVPGDLSPPSTAPTRKNKNAESLIAHIVSSLHPHNTPMSSVSLLSQSEKLGPVRFSYFSSCPDVWPQSPCG